MIGISHTAAKKRALTTRYLAWGLLFTCLLLLIGVDAFAHEAWVLTPAEAAEWNARPKPPIFTQLTPTNVSFLVAGGLFVVAWVLLGRTGAREMFPDLRLQLASYGHYGSLAVRISLVIMLGMAAFGLSPRHGTEFLEAPTLVAPDLELRLLAGNWEWLAWVLAVATVAFALGIYVRLMAAIVLALDVLGLFLFGYAMLAYVGIVAAGAVYLLFRGGGLFFLPLRVPAFGQRLIDWFEDQPYERVQLMVQVLAGVNFIYLGIAYKFLQPNLSMAFLIRDEIFTFGMDYQTFVFVMFLVETLAGVFMVFGVMMRAMSVILFGAFLFLSYSLGENPIGHIIFYGILFTFITNGSGRWRRPEAVDTPGEIVILGGGFAAVHCAMRLEKLLGQYSNVRVTLVHQRDSFIFSPLLPEVIGGSIQPGSIINPLRRICPRTRMLHHRVARIDTAAREVHLSSGYSPVVVRYDRLIVALDPEPEFGQVPGLVDHGLPMVTIGDALYLRQRVLENMEVAESHDDPAERAALLSFCVIGGGVLGCAVAAELRNLIRAALPSFPGIRSGQTRVALVEAGSRVLPRYSQEISDAALRRLRRLGVEVIAGSTVGAVTLSAVICGDERQPISCRTVVGTQSDTARLYRQLSHSSTEGADAQTEPPSDPYIFAVGHGASELPLMVLREIRAGRRAGYNALAGIQGMRQKPWRPDQPATFAVNLGMHASVAQLWGLRLGGRLAWILHRLTCLFTLPGLERNLRILVDWLFDVVFRDDIAVLAPQQTVKLSGAHFEPGDTIFREGEDGDSAYVILSGKVEVTRVQNREPVSLATLVEGECFGEIALMTNQRRTATVTCLTPVDVTVLHREQFLALSEGFHDLGEAMRSKMRRHAAADQNVGLD